MKRWAAFGGVIGPAAFVTAWLVGGLATSRDYTPIDDAISRLAEVGADTRVLMTIGFVIFGFGLPVFAMAVRRQVDGPAWITAGLTGLATLGVAVTPLERTDFVDQLHGVFAGFGYVTLALTPFLAARPLLRSGRDVLAVVGLLAGTVSAIALALTLSDLPTGLVQRVGLTSTDVWIVALAVALVRVGDEDEHAGSDPVLAQSDRS